MWSGPPEPPPPQDPPLLHHEAHALIPRSTVVCLKLMNQRIAEHSGSVDGALYWGSKCWWFEPHCLWSHCVFVLEQDPLPALSTYSSQEDPS